MRGLTFLLANLLPSVPSPSLSLSSPLSFSFSPPYPFFWNHSGNCIVVAPECLHTRTQAEMFHFCARTYRLLVVYVQQGRLSHARHFLFVLFEGLLDFSFFFGRGEQIVVTLIVTRTLLCDKIPAFYFHPTIKDPSSDLKLGFLSLHIREHGSSEWNMVEHIVHRLHSDSGKMCEEIRLSSAYTISSNRMRQFNDLPGARVYRPSSRVSSPRLRASKHGIEFTIGGWYLTFNTYICLSKFYNLTLPINMLQTRYRCPIDFFYR